MTTDVSGVARTRLMTVEARILVILGSLATRGSE